MKLSLKKTLCKVLQRLDLIDDWVVERGTSGVWTYRKWNSGIAECWGKIYTAWPTTTQWGYSYYGSYKSFSLPTGVFNDSPVVSIGLDGGRGYFAMSGAKKDYIGGYVYNASNESGTAFTVHAVIKGTWK